MALKTKYVTVGTTAVQLYPTRETAVEKVLVVKAASTNTGIIHVGPLGVTDPATEESTAGIELLAGESVPIDVNHSVGGVYEDDVYAISDTAGQKVSLFLR